MSPLEVGLSLHRYYDEGCRSLCIPDDEWDAFSAFAKSGLVPGLRDLGTAAMYQPLLDGPVMMICCDRFVVKVDLGR